VILWVQFICRVSEQTKTAVRSLSPPSVTSKSRGESGLRELAQHVLQNAAVLVVVELVRGIDAAGHGEGLRGAVIALRRHGELLG